MTTDLKDLLSGRPVRKGDNALVPGRWWLPTCPSGAAVNGIEAADGDRVVPRRDRSWSVQSDRLERWDGEFSQRVLASSADTDALSQMNEQFEARLASRAVWDDWVAASPLAPRLDDYLRILPFDEILEENLVFLETVCAMPRTHLKVESDLVPTARARRVARQAIARLASHREDWERPTVLGVRPRRVLCLVPDENADIYENRLAARLVDHIRLYLQMRLARLADIRRMLSQISDHASGAASGHHWRRDRLYALWAEAIRDNAPAVVAVHTQARLDALYLRVLGLLDSPLYRAVPHGAPVSGLRYTNILSNDPHYRKVAMLWERWTKLGAERPLSDQQVYERQQSVCSAMSWFSWLVVVRAAKQLHLQPEASFQSTTVDDIPIQLVGPVSDCTITPPRDAVVTIRCGGIAIRVVGIPAVLDGETSEDVEHLRHNLGNAAAVATEDHVLLLHLPASRVQASSPMEVQPSANWRSACAWEPANMHGTKLSVLPISPWDIASVERVARYLRWHLHAQVLLAYPPTVRCSMPSVPADMQWTARADTRDEWRVLRRPKPRERGLDDFLSTARDALHKAVASTGGKAAQHARRDAEERTEQLRLQMQIAFKRLDKLCICPVCWRPHGDLELLDLSASAFTAKCPACNTAWGVFRCRCGIRFPVIQLQNIERLVNGHSNRSVGWIDALLGCDVLAVPCEHTSDRFTLVCNGCKRCACNCDVPHLVAAEPQPK